MSADMYALLAVPVFCLMGNGILRVCKAWQAFGKRSRQVTKKVQA